ncbi:MAG: peptidoglycan endopeptidase [Anaerolineaceae bacterium]|nr:MAG: peptidoglycan endopeptidase [Anaerolineaceae bacterium]
MTRGIRKIATYCMIGSLTFMGTTKTAHASVQPIAGITVLLNDISINPEITNVDISNILEPIIEYHDLAIANVTNYVNIRSEANANSKVLGKLYNKGTGTILAKEGEWTKIKSGNVTGYIMSEYLYTGSEVYDLADDVKTRLATVRAKVLNVRSKAGTNSSVVTQVPKGHTLEVLDEQEEWIKISVGGKTGYVASNYVNIDTDFKHAISIEEEQELINLEKQRQEAQESKTVSSLRQQIVNYALRFKGNPYVWGGTSLTRGADCSGFTQSVLKNFGIYIPRTSRAQAYGGKRVSMNKIQPGDLIFYRKRGVVNHVAMYIGNGKVIGASSRKEGINIKNYNYRTPYKAVSYINR